MLFAGGTAMLAKIGFQQMGAGSGLTIRTFVVLNYLLLQEPITLKI